MGGGFGAPAGFGAPPSNCTDPDCPHCAAGGTVCPATGKRYYHVSKEAAELIAGVLGMGIVRVPYAAMGIEVPEKEAGALMLQPAELEMLTGPVRLVMQRRLSFVGEWDDIIAMLGAGVALGISRVGHAESLKQRGFQRQEEEPAEAA